MYVVDKRQCDAACKCFIVISCNLIVNGYRSRFGQRRAGVKFIRSLYRTVLHGITLSRVGNRNGNSVRLAVDGSVHVVRRNGHRLGIDRYIDVLGGDRIGFGLRSSYGDNCGAGLHDREVTLRINSDRVAALDRVAERTVSGGDRCADLQAGITKGCGNVARLDGLRLTERFENGESAGQDFPDIIIGIFAHSHRDGVCAFSIALFAGSGVVESISLDYAALKFVERGDQRKVGVPLRYRAIGREYDVVDCKEVSVITRAAIL